MKRFRSNTLGQVLCFVAVALFVLPMNAVSVFARGGPKATTKIKHEPIEYFVPENRIKLETDVTDKEGVNLVRCYFRAVEQADYVFVAMTPGSSLYTGVLPAPSKKTEMLEYLFLVVNGKNQVVKTQTFKVEKGDEDETPAWQEVSSKGDIRVSTELAQAPTAPPGFTDSIAMDVVESSARFGLVVAGIYTAAQAAEAGGTTGTAAAADSAGTISAKTGGISKLAYVGGAALVAAGAAALGGGGSGDGDGSNVTVSKRSVDMRFWDCDEPGEHGCDNDEDAIRIILNRATIYGYHELTGGGEVKHVDLNPDQTNTLEIVAENDGVPECPGNRVCLDISDVTAGKGDWQWDLSTTGRRSTSITISVRSATTSTTTTTTTTTTAPTTTTTTTSTTTAPTTTTYQTTSTTTVYDPCQYNSPPQVYYACVSDEPLYVDDILTA